MILAMPAVLVDTSVWIDHLRSSSTRLVDLLAARRALIHPFVVGELACGSLRSRNEFVSQLLVLPHTTSASNDEALQLLENHKLYGKGLSWVDVHLLASATITRCSLWSTDKALASAAEDLGLA
jgi:predicted nucleic acid-binding protein